MRWYPPRGDDLACFCFAQSGYHKSLKARFRFESARACVKTTVPNTTTTTPQLEPLEVLKISLDLNRRAIAPAPRNQPTCNRTRNRRIKPRQTTAAVSFNCIVSARPSGRLLVPPTFRDYVVAHRPSHPAPSRHSAKCLGPGRDCPRGTIANRQPYHSDRITRVPRIPPPPLEVPQIQAHQFNARTHSAYILRQDSASFPPPQ